jgi:hypothetical protein
MVEIDVYQNNKDFGFIEFVETYVGPSLDDCKARFPNMIYMNVKAVVR